MHPQGGFSPIPIRIPISYLGPKFPLLLTIRVTRKKRSVGWFYRDINFFFGVLLNHNSSFLFFFAKIIEVQLITSQKTKGIATQWT